MSMWASQVALVVTNLPANAGDIRDSGSIPGSGRSLGGGHGNPFQYSCLENPMDRGNRQAMVHRVVKSQSWLKQPSMQRYANVGSLIVTNVGDGGRLCRYEARSTQEISLSSAQVC